MQVILLERVERLGDMGDEVTVKPGFARNYLLPQHKALRANDENRSLFDARRTELEELNRKRRDEALGIAGGMHGAALVLVRQAGETGQLYGSVSSRDIAQTLGEADFTVAHNQIQLDRPIKELGIYPVHIVLHPEVTETITVNVARSEEEAKLQADRLARGEEVVRRPGADDFDDDDFDDETEETLQADEEAADGAGEEAEEASELAEVSESGEAEEEDKTA
ncbi:MAG: 50S ribosomal protein L9 [Rhodospirillaceae bacterium]|jgi:large subunit ribosomal protein L9|nr:50S ribosomal protein L9 [Rhodospirillaceae bacterium]